MTFSKNTFYVVGIAFVVLVFTMAILNNSSVDDREENEVQESPTPVVTQTVQPRARTVASPLPPEIKAQINYQDLVTQFEGRRIQFDAGCQAIPSELTFKNGTQIMLDNRSGDGRWISVDGTGYFIDGLGFKILTLLSDELPHTANINCGSAVNVGRIHLQK